MPNGGGGIPGIPIGRELQLPGETAAQPTGWLLERLLGCDLDGPNAPTCVGDSDASNKERAVAIAVADVVKGILPPCPGYDVLPVFAQLASTTAEAILWSEMARTMPQRIPPTGTAEYWLLKNDLRRYGEFRYRISVDNQERGCSPAPAPTSPTTPTPPGGYPPIPPLPNGPQGPSAKPQTPLAASANFSIGVLFLLGGAALYLAGKRDTRTI
jgi:hypothetical protein